MSRGASLGCASTKIPDEMDIKETCSGIPNREEPQEYNRNIMEYKDCGKYIPMKFLLYS